MLLKRVAIGFFAFCAISTLFSSFSIVDTGHRGVLTRFGKIDEVPLPEGLHFKNPFTEKIISLDVRTLNYSAETFSYTKDMQNVKVVFSVNYRPDVSHVAILYRDVGIDWGAKLLSQTVLGKIKEIIGQYTAIELVDKRQVVIDQIDAHLKENLARKSILMSNFEVKDFEFNPEFEKAVEGKVVAIEKAKEAVNKTVIIQEQAKQSIIQAEAAAQSMRIRSAALSQNQNLVEYEAVQKWDGHLPQYMLGNSTPFINLDKK